MRGHYVARLNLLRSERMQHPVADKIGQTSLIQMLQLATAANREMRARRIGMVRAVDQTAAGIKAISGRCERHMPPICGNAVAA